MTNVKTVLRGGVVMIAALSAPAQAQETLLSRLVGQIGEDSRMSWDEGRRVETSEVYDGLRLATPGFVLNAETLQLTPKGNRLEAEADSVVFNSKTDSSFSFEADKITLFLGSEHVRLVSKRKLPRDFCALGAANMELTLEKARLVRNVEGGDEALLRRRDRVEKLDIEQGVEPTGTGCKLSASADMEGYERLYSDQSGATINALSVNFEMPGNVDTLIAGSVPEITLDLDIGGYEMRVSDGAPGVVMRDGQMSAEVLSRSAAPLLTSLIRTRGDTSLERTAAAYEAARDVVSTTRFSANALVARVQNFMPGTMAGELSRADLTSVIGDYDGVLSTDEAHARLEVNGDLTGLSRTKVDLALDLSPYQEDDFPGAGEVSLDALGLPVSLDRLLMEQTDEGFLRAFETFTGSTFSVFAALYSGKLVSEIPEPLRPAARFFLGRANIFFQNSARGGTGKARITTPTDLNLYETYLLGESRPDLIPRALKIEVTQE